MLQALNIFLHNSIPLLILLNFLLLIILTYINWPDFRKLLQRVDAKVWIALLLLFVISLVIRSFIPPHQHILYFDEAWYMEAAKDMIQTGSQGDYPKSIGWPFILRIAFSIFGISNWVAIYTSILIGSLTVFTVFLVTYAITKQSELSLISSILFSLFPAHIRWSASAETNVASIFFITLTLFFMYMYFDKKKFSMLWLCFASIAFTAQIRPENYSLIALFALGVFMYERNIKAKELLKFATPLAVLLLLSVPNLVQVLDNQLSTNWIESDTSGEQTGSNWSLDNLIGNSMKYGRNLFNSRFQPLAIPILALVGLFCMIKKNFKESLLLLAWFLILWIVYFTSWFQTLGGNDRFYMSFYFIIAICASYGLSLFSRLMPKKRWIKRILTLIATAVIILLFVPYVRGVFLYHSDDAHLLETMIPELAEKDLPAECMIIANWPTVLKSTTSLNVVDIDLFDSMQEKPDCILFFEDMLCIDIKMYKAKCDEIKEKYELDVFKTYSAGNRRFVFHKLSEQEKFGELT